jgi:orotidine-5'-phosphate decarboxylase
MADVKLHDIPSTMENSIGKLVGAGANIVTIHCSSNYRPKNAALLKYIAGVTALTSFTDLEIKWIYDKPHEEIIRAFSDIALMNSYEYIVGSVKDMNLVHENPLKKICTGIRPAWYTERHDQIRIATIKEALRMEPEFIVVGRPITTAGNMMEVIERLSTEIR